jgi:hypothetical protein
MVSARSRRQFKTPENGATHNVMRQLTDVIMEVITYSAGLAQPGPFTCVWHACTCPSWLTYDSCKWRSVLHVSKSPYPFKF